MNWSTGKILTWYGQDVNELSKEKLIEALEWCMGEIERQRNNHRGTLEILDLVCDRGISK